MAIMDFGMTGGLTKFVGEFKGKEDPETLSKLINTALTFYVLVGLVTALILGRLSFCFDLIFKVAPVNQALE